MRGLLTILLLILATTVMAQQKTIDPTTEFNNKLADYSGKIKTIKCNFVQVKHAEALINDVKMKGTFYYNNGGRMCLDYSEPKGNQIVINNDKFAIQTDGKRNVVSAASNPMLRQLSSMLKACMTGDVSMFNSGWSTQYFELGSEYIVEMTPIDKRAKKFMAKIVLNFNKANMSLNKMKMVEPSGDYSQYEFSDKIFNSDIAESIFEI